MLPHRPILCAALSLSISCQPGSRGKAQTPVAVQARVAQRCPELLPAQGKINLSKTRLYVEVALLVGTEANGSDAKRPSPNALVSSLEGQASEVTSVMQFIANPGVPTTMPWGDCLDAACDNRNARITLIANFSTEPGVPVTVNFWVEKLPSSVTEAPRIAPQQVDWQTTYKKELSLHDQQPLVVDDPDYAIGNGETVVTGYLLTRPKDLFRVMACKAKQIGTSEIRPVAARPQ